MARHKTTDRDFEDFRRYCRKWQDVFSLAAWDLLIEWRKVKDGSAETYTDHSQHTATIFLHKGVICFSVEVLAFHEVCEVMLSSLREMAEKGNNDGEVDAEVHKVINTLQLILSDRFEKEAGDVVGSR